MRRLTLTFDTCCMQLKPDENLSRLEKFHEEGIIEIRKTDVLDTEKKFGGTPIKSITEKELKKTSGFEEDIGFGVFDSSRFDHAVFSSKKDAKRLEDLKRLIFPDLDKMNEKNKIRSIRDCMHLNTHIMRGSHIFVTKEKAFLRKGKQLLHKYKTIILNPKICVDIIELWLINNGKTTRSQK